MSVESAQRRSDGALVVETTRVELLSLARRLRDQGYTHVVSVTAIDYPAENKMVLVVHVGGYGLEKGKPKIVEIRVPLDRRDPLVPSLTPVWPSAEFLERETYDMFGVIFEGHPDLRRILLYEEDFPGIHPMRKDFIVPEEGIDYKQGWGELRG